MINEFPDFVEIIKVTDTFFAVLLASGFSDRFGSGNKLLAPFRGKPLARHTLDLVCGMGCFERIFFIYADNDVAVLAREHADAGCALTPVFNLSPRNGQGESVRLGVKAADEYLAAAARCCPETNRVPENVYYLFLPCDQPLLDAGTLRLVLDEARPGCIVEPASHHSPCLFSASFRDELLALKPNEMPRLLKTRHPGALIQIEVPNPAVLVDIDTPLDLERLA